MVAALAPQLVLPLVLDLAAVLHLSVHAVVTVVLQKYCKSANSIDLIFEVEGNRSGAY